MAVCAAIEAELIQLEEDERTVFLEELGLTEPDASGGIGDRGHDLPRSACGFHNRSDGIRIPGPG